MKHKKIPVFLSTWVPTLLLMGGQGTNTASYDEEAEKKEWLLWNIVRKK